MSVGYRDERDNEPFQPRRLPAPAGDRTPMRTVCTTCGDELRPDARGVYPPARCGHTEFRLVPQSR